MRNGLGKLCDIQDRDPKGEKDVFIYFHLLSAAAVPGGAWSPEQPTKAL